MGYKTKAEWASAEAQKLGDQIQRLKEPHIPSSQWQRIRRREEVHSQLRTKQRKFERLADKFRKQGT